MQPLTKKILPLNIDGTPLQTAALFRTGSGVPLVFLHGFGSTKEDYADLALHAEWDNHPFIAFDAPGCGETQCDDLTKISIPFLVKTALAVLESFGVERFHLVGHSMGGLTALMLAHQQPQRVASFINIEGNIAPEDCFLSRQIIEFADNDEIRFFQRFIERTYLAPAFSSALYAVSLPHKVRAGAVKPIFSSMVDLSDHGGLMEKFLALPCPKMFMYGAQNAHLSYLPHIGRNGVVLSEIPHCGHFPMYSNPAAMWQSMAAFWATIN